MANTLTIQLRPTKKYSAPSIANLIHNAGLAKATYWLKEAKGNIKNKYTIPSVKKAIENWRWWEHFAKEIILQKKHRKPLKNQILIEEGLMIIGKDVPKKDPKIFIEIFKEFANWFEEKYKTQILFWSFHNHEGHLDQEGEFSENLHIHFFFRNVNNDGESVRRQIKKEDLSYFQSKIYEIGKKYIPTLQRATNYKELGLKAPKHLSHREYRTQKIKDTQLRLAPEIKSIKKENKELKEENKELLARVKDLKEENKRIREQFKELGAVRQDYAKLEQLVRELKEKIKAKNLTIEEMQEEFNKQLEELKEKLKEEQEKKEKLKDLAYSKKYQKDNRNATNAEVVEFLENKVKELQKKLLQSENRVQLLQEENKKLKQENNKIEEIVIEEIDNNNLRPLSIFKHTPYFSNLCVVLDKKNKIVENNNSFINEEKLSRNANLFFNSKKEQLDENVNLLIKHSLIYFKNKDFLYKKNLNNKLKEKLKELLDKETKVQLPDFNSLNNTEQKEEDTFFYKLNNFADYILEEFENLRNEFKKLEDLIILLNQDLSLNLLFLLFT